MLIPDKLDEDDQPKSPKYGVFATTVVLFFLAEMGDKTQIATVALAARYQELTAVVAGTTLGMMLANVPVVFLGERITRLVPLHWVHRICAVIFVGLAVAAVLW
jgi:putative Ca2+/H+ antiporter (TMEM165/GDT1 family)